MHDDGLNQWLQIQGGQTLAKLEQCNEISGQYGLRLSRRQMQALLQHRTQTLAKTGRVEFGESILPKLIYAFCDSPYLLQQHYEETLMELQELFYFFKGEAAETLSDDELVEYMKVVFNGKAQGSLEYLAGTSLEQLCRRAREGWNPRDAEDWEEFF